MIADDANNYSPAFAQSSYSFTISAYTGTGVSVGTIAATDADSGTFGDVVFNFTTTSQYFSVSTV